MLYLRNDYIGITDMVVMGVILMLDIRIFGSCRKYEDGIFFGLPYNRLSIISRNWTSDDMLIDVVDFKCPLCNETNIRLLFAENNVMNCMLEEIDPNVLTICKYCERIIRNTEIDVLDGLYKQIVSNLIKSMGEIEV